MNRRHFLNRTTVAAAGLFWPHRGPRTEHLILIVPCGARKKDYYEDASLAPNIHRLVREGFVFEEDHCERISSHNEAFAELLRGRESVRTAPAYPTLLDYVGDAVPVESMRDIPGVLQGCRPRLIVCRQTMHEVAHESYETYVNVVRQTDASIGTVFDWITAHPEFSPNTAMVIRPEFGRDDDVNEHGQLHHSYGYYYAHRVATIFWGPDFNTGIDRTTVIQAQDLAPTVAAVFGIRATYAKGRVVPGLLRTRRTFFVS